MKRRMVLVSLLALLALLASACSGGAKQAPRDSASSNSGSAASKPEIATASPAPSQAAPMTPPASGAATTGNSKSMPPVSTTSTVTGNQKVIMNADLEMKIKDADDAVSRIVTAVKQAGGIVQTNQFTGTKGKGRSVAMILRVPSGSYADAVSSIAGLAEEVMSRREWAQDVTDQFIDLEARVKTQEAHLAQLQKLYDRAGSIKEMMDLEQEISRVTSDIESMKGRLRYLTDQVEYSTINVKLYEPDTPVPVQLQTPKTVAQRIRVAFLDSWHGVVNFTGDLVVFVVGALPILAYLAIFGGIGYAGYRVVRRRFRRPPAA